MATLPEPLVERHNRTTEWQGPPRFGVLDLVSLRYAADVLRTSCGLTMDLELAVTHLDLGTGVRLLAHAGSVPAVVSEYAYHGEDEPAARAHLTSDATHDELTAAGSEQVKKEALRVSIIRPAAERPDASPSTSVLLAQCRPVLRGIAEVEHDSSERKFAEQSSIGWEARCVIHEMEAAVGARCTLASLGPRAEDKVWLS